MSVVRSRSPRQLCSGSQDCQPVLPVCTRHLNRQSSRIPAVVGFGILALVIFACFLSKQGPSAAFHPSLESEELAHDAGPKRRQLDQPAATPLPVQATLVSVQATEVQATEVEASEVKAARAESSLPRPEVLTQPEVLIKLEVPEALTEPKALSEPVPKAKAPRDISAAAVRARPEKICEDKNTGCAAWAASGECSRNPPFMQTVCRLSCGTCRGFTAGALSNKPSVPDGTSSPSSPMDTKPQKTARQAGVEARKAERVADGVDCANSHADAECDKWARTGECRGNPNFMHVQCRRSCNLCTLATSTSR